MSSDWTQTEIEIAKRIAGSGRRPSHVAMIMDGNGRWAKKRFMPRVAGHRAAVQVVRMAVKVSGELNIEYLTLYAFSTENWNRPRAEVNALMELLVRYLRVEADELDRNNVRLRTMGRTDQLPAVVRKALDETIERLDKNTGLTLILALSYSGRAEIIDGMKKILEQSKKDGALDEKLDESTFRNYLYLPTVPDPDLVIRTSGEQRISNFYLWQLAYSELAMTETLWPDFNRHEYLNILDDYCVRERRFGGLAP